MGWFVPFLQLRTEKTNPSKRTPEKIFMGRWSPDHPAASMHGDYV